MLTHPGVYCLRTNELAWDEKTLWQTYTMMTDLGAVLRSLKSELGLRPIYHHKEIRAEGHFFITVKQRDGRTLHVRKTTSAEPKLSQLYEALGLSAVQKLVI